MFMEKIIHMKLDAQNWNFIMNNINLKLPFMKNNTNFKIHNCAVAIASLFLLRKKFHLKLLI